MGQATKKVLVVGGAGYVGSVLVPELLERGYAVKVFDRMFYGDLGLKDSRDRVELVVGDMRAMDPSLLHDVSSVVNLGGLSNDPTAEYNPKANFEMNTVATEKLAVLCKQAGIQRYVFASSASIYDFGEGAEAKDQLLDENADVDPKAAYSRSKYEAERILLKMTDANFCPVMLRKGTIYGFSPRMRYDLVVNTFVMSALTKGFVTMHAGGEMWRPLVDVRDAAKAYVIALQAPAEKVRGQIFNVVYKNFRISELAFRVREGLRAAGCDTEIRADYKYKGVRNYRITGKRMETLLDFRPTISIEDSVKDLVEKIRAYSYTDFDNPRYYNIRWMKVLEEVQSLIKHTGTIFEMPEEVAAPAKPSHGLRAA